MRNGNWVAAAVVAAMVPAGPAAADEVPMVTWDCWYQAEGGPAVACRLHQAPQASTGGTSPMPQDTIAHRIRSQPASLADEVLVIPLYSPTEDMARAARLARAVMCGTQASCAVNFIAQPPRG